MKYLVLNGVTQRKDLRFAYRGTDRNSPRYCSSLPAEHEFNQLWLEAIKEEQNTGGISDLAKAQRYAELSNRYFPDMHFEVIGISMDNDASAGGGQLLGYDIGSGESLIVLAALPFGPIQYGSDEPAIILNEMIRRHFHPKLNEFGLFRTSEDAEECRRAMIALQSLRPNFYEGGSLELFRESFKITGVYLIP